MLARVPENIKYFDKTLGQSKRLSGELKLVSERITAGELIRQRIENEHEKSVNTDNTVHMLIAPSPKEIALNGTKAYGPKPIDANALKEKNVQIAFTGFKTNSFLLFFDNKQIESLDETVTVGENCSLTFVKLVPLVGG